MMLTYDQEEQNKIPSPMLSYATKIQCGWPISLQPKPCHHSQVAQCIDKVEATGPSWIAFA